MKQDTLEHLITLLSAGIVGGLASYFFGLWGIIIAIPIGFMFGYYKDEIWNFLKNK